MSLIQEIQQNKISSLNSFIFLKNRHQKKNLSLCFKVCLIKLFKKIRKIFFLEKFFFYLK